MVDEGNPLHHRPELDPAGIAILEGYLALHFMREVAISEAGAFPLPIRAADVWAAYKMTPLPCTAMRWFELVRHCDACFLRDAYARLTRNGHRRTRG